MIDRDDALEIRSSLNYGYYVWDLARHAPVAQFPQHPRHSRTQYNACILWIREGKIAS